MLLPKTDDIHQGGHIPVIQHTWTSIPPAIAMSIFFRYAVEAPNSAYSTRVLYRIGDTRITRL